MLLATLAVMILAFWLMSRFARKQQEKMAAEQAQRVEEALVPGTWVRTRAGFYGKVVEVDGDVVTLATALGDESLWAKNAIFGAEEPPFATIEAEDAELAEETTDAPAALPGQASDAVDNESPEGSAEAESAR